MKKKRARGATEYSRTQIGTKTHCASEFFLDEEADWIGTPSSPMEPRDTNCLP